MKFLQFFLCATILFLFSCGDGESVNMPDKEKAKASLEAAGGAANFLNNIKLPDGFKIEIYAEDVINARSMALSPNGTLFVGTRDKGSVYALQDTDGDLKIDKKYVLAEKLLMPNGVAFRDGDLYVAEVNRVIKFEDIENNLANPKPFTVINDTYPDKKHHGWKYIAFGPDGKLYIPVGAPCNICESKEEIFNTITRINADGSGKEIVQKGVRNSVGFDWHPETKEMWFTDNGRDWMGEDVPACELNRASEDNMHFGYPYCHQGDMPDPKINNGKDCNEFAPPALKLGAHVAPLGLEFVQSSQFPEDYQGHLIIAEHGSWNRKEKSGYQLTLVKIANNTEAISAEPFAEGWLNKEDDEVWGRPVDVEFMSDGSMLVSDDFADVIYRISYGG